MTRTSPHPHASDSMVILNKEMSFPKRILVTTDFSSLSHTGIEAAVSLAKLNPESLLVLVHVASPMAMTARGDDADTDRQMTKIEEDMRRFSSSIDRDIPFQTRIVVGHPSLEICTMAREEKFDLITISSHGRTGMERMLIGSVAERIVHDSPCPVLVVKPLKDKYGSFMNETKPVAWRRILVGFDHRPGAEQALSMAKQIARHSKGHLALIHALEPFDSRMAVHYLCDLESEAEFFKQAMADLEHIRDDHLPDSAPWDLRIEHGHPWDVIADYSRKHAIDLIVVGPHEHTRWGHDFMGSTAQRVVRLAECAVLAVK